MERLKAVVESLDGIDESVRGLYRATDEGKHVISLDGIDQHPDVVGLKRHQQRLLDEAKRAKEERDELKTQFDGLDPARAREALAKYEEWEAKGSLPDEDAIPRELHEKRLKAKEEQINGKLSEKDQRIQRLESALQQKEVVGSLRSAIAKAGVLDRYREAVEALLMSKGPDVVWDGDTPRGVFRNEFGEAVAIEDFVLSWAKTGAADPYMPASGNQGSDSRTATGARGSGGVNPFKAETRNITEQMRLVKENPEQARLLAQEAGVRLPKLSA